MNFFCCLALLIVCFASSIAYAVDHQYEIAKAQKWADSFKRPYPIIIIDRDKTNFLIKSNNAYKVPDKNFEIISDYFKKNQELYCLKKTIRFLRVI